MSWVTSAISAMRLLATPNIDPSERAPDVGPVRRLSAGGDSSINGGRDRNLDKRAS